MVANSSLKLSTAVRLAVVDERRLIAEAIAALLGKVMGSAVKGLVAGDRALTAIAVERPDIVLVGVGAGSEAGLDLVRSLQARQLELQIVLIADELEPEIVRFVRDQRLSGLLLSDVGAAEILACLDQVAHGHAVMPAGWQALLDQDAGDSLSALTQRQMEVLRLLADGCSYEEIGTRLFITVNTVKYHARSIFLRLGVSNRMAAARHLVDHDALPAGRSLTVLKGG
jgi:DNA-binding NarL/FixJ family response regulator